MSLERALVTTSLFLAVLAPACSTPRPSSGNDAAIDAPSTPGSDTGAPGDDASSGPTIRGCFLSCTTTADCVMTGAPAYIDEDNYACTGGYCHYLGCHDDAECSVLPGYRCGTGEIRSCVRSCTAPTDCAPTGSPAYVDADNYECTGGTCVYLGCRSDTECADMPSGTTYRCDLAASLPTCTPSCTTRDDCPAAGAPAYADVDNYVCESGLCAFAGCNSDTECAAIPSGTFICR